MRKGFKSLALLLALVTAAGSLASCSKDYTYPDASWTDGVVATVGGKTVGFSDVYTLFSDKKDSVKAYFSTAENLIAQFVTPRTDSIIAHIDSKISEQEQTWKKNASTNNTSYKEEMQKTLDSEGVIDEDALRDKWIAAEQVSDNKTAYTEDNFGTVTTINGASADDTTYSYYVSEEETQKYVDTVHPYHVSHILVKVDAASGGEGTYKGEISSTDANQITNVVKGLISSSSFGDTAQLLSDDSSNTSYGDLFAGSSGTLVGTSTSYVNEFKLGLFAYDAFINPTTKSNTAVKSGLRVPGTATGEITSSAVASNIANTSFGKSKAYGIPLSVAIELSQVADQDKADSGYATVSEDKYTVSADQYPRNVLFNNYFNNHALSFVYDDRSEYATRFIEEALDFEKNLVNSSDTVTATRAAALVAAVSAASDTTAKLALIAACSDLTERYKAYKQVCALIGLDPTTGTKLSSDSPVDETKFKTVTNVSDNLEAYTTDYTETAGIKTAGSTSIQAISAHNVLVDEKGYPIMVTRAGTGSGDSGYQGLHFITVNRSSWGTGDDATDKKNNEGAYAYRYYRVNIPDDNKGATDTAYTSDYSVNPSVVNFVKGDLKNGKGNETTYNDRISKIRSLIGAYDSNTDFKIWEANLAKFKTMYGKDFGDLLGNTKDSAGNTVTIKSLIDEYVTYTRESATTTANDTLDSSWETYVNSTVLNEEMQPKRIIPTVCVSYFQSGVINAEEEELCHVKK
jgi:hypothetical protein